jgi:hypothetical protein
MPETYVDGFAGNFDMFKSVACLISFFFAFVDSYLLFCCFPFVFIVLFAHSKLVLDLSHLACCFCSVSRCRRQSG